MKKTLSCVALASVLCSSAFAIGGPSGAKLDYAITGQIGEVVVNPYDTYSSHQKWRLHTKQR